MYTTSAPVSPNLTTESRSSREERRRPVLLYSTTSMEMVGSLSTCVLYDSQITESRSSREEEEACLAVLNNFYGDGRFTEYMCTVRQPDN